MCIHSTTTATAATTAIGVSVSTYQSLQLVHDELKVVTALCQVLPEALLQCTPHTELLCLNKALLSVCIDE
jgi:hypothetical protein